MLSCFCAIDCCGCHRVNKPVGGAPALLRRERHWVRSSFADQKVEPGQQKKHCSPIKRFFFTAALIARFNRRQCATLGQPAIVSLWVKRLGGLYCSRSLVPKEKCRAAPQVKAPTNNLFHGHLYRSPHHETRLPTHAARPDIMHRAATAPRASNQHTSSTYARRTGMGATGLRHARPGGATGGLSPAQQEFRYADRHL